MQKRSGKDINESAFSVVRLATQQDKKVSAPDKNPAAVALGRLGGLKGGKVRASRMTKEERSESARKAAGARWRKKK